MESDSATLKIRQAALRLLACRDHTALEIKQKLQAKGHAAMAIGSIIEALKTEGLLNEARFTENYIHYRQARGYGPKRIANELEARGVSSEMIAEHLDITDNAWFKEMRKVWQKQFKGLLPKDFKTKAKQLRFLYYRGYTQEQVNSIFHGHNDYDE